MSRHLAKALVLVVGVGLAAACSSGSNNNSGKQFSGVTVRVVTFTGPQIAEPLQRRAPDFEKATGAKVQIITVPFSDLYQKLLTDFATKTNSYDATVFDPQWMGDYVPPGYLEDLSDRVKNDSTLQWDDIAPFFRDFSATFKGKVYTIPLDGDFQMVYYRKDLLQKDGLKAPETWQDYIDIAKHFQGKDLNGDGKADYGSCLAMKRSAQSYWAWLSVAAAFLQSQGTKQGAFFNTSNMQPLTNNPAAAAALDVYKQLSKIGPPTQLNDDVGNSRGLFITGRCALSLDWGDIGTLAIDPSQSKVQDKVGAVILPGSKQVLDRSTMQLVDCNPTLCPNAVSRLRRLVGSDQQSVIGQGQGRCVCFPRVHVGAEAIRRRRHHRQDGFQPVPDVAVLQPRPVDQGWDEHAGSERLPGRHQVEPAEPQHGPRPSHHAKRLLRADSA